MCVITEQVFKDAIEALRISYKKMNPFCVPFVTTNMRSAMLAMDLVSCVLLLHKRFCNIIKVLALIVPVGLLPHFICKVEYQMFLPLGIQIAREAEKLRKRKKLDARTVHSS